MLSKLLKHEFRATARIMLPVYLLLAVSTGLFCLTMHLNRSYDLLALSIFHSLVVFVFVVTIIGAGVFTLALMVYRFYKNYMTDEGYLMFTLPATTGELIWSKLIVATVWSALTVLVICAALALAAVTQPGWADFLPDLREMLSYLFDRLSAGQTAAYIAELSALALLNCLRTLLLFYAAVALGHSFANHKILLSVAFYFAFSIALRTVGAIGGSYGIVAAVENELFTGDPLVWGHSLALGSILITLVPAAAFYLVTYFTLKKRLNLQ